MEFKLPAVPEGTASFCTGAVAGAILIGWAGFDAFGWKTSAAADLLAARRVDMAIVASHARICSARFGRSGDASARLDELRRADRYTRGDVIEKAGFATMVGEKESHPGVSQACADLLLPEAS